MKISGGSSFTLTTGNENTLEEGDLKVRGNSSKGGVINIFRN